MKTCSKCGRTKSLSEFFNDVTRVDGKCWACKTCDASRHKKFYLNNIEKLRGQAVARRNQNIDKARLDARTWRMKNPEKQAAACKSWGERNPERLKALHKKHNLKRKYGLSLERYEELNSEQGGVCAICKKKDSAGRRLAVDHSHITGQIRALLCGNCNAALGLVNDSTETLFSAIAYLKRFSTPKAEN